MAIGDVLIGLAVLVLVFVVIRLLAEFQIDRRRAATVEALGAPRDARKLYERATAAARKGDFTAASRLLFAATVVALDLRGVVTEDPSATVGDLRRALRSRRDGAGAAVRRSRRTVRGEHVRRTPDRVRRLGPRACRISHLRTGARADVRRHLVELIIVILSAIVIGALAFGREAARNALPHSTYSTNDTGPNGYRGALRNAALGRRARYAGSRACSACSIAASERWCSQPTRSDPDPQPMGAGDTALLKDFVERGGRLVVLDYDFEGK